MEAEPDLRQTFVADATLRLDRMGEQLLELERSPAKKDLITGIFRDAHSLKGAAGVLGLKSVTEVAHALESPLQRMRAGELVPDEGVTDALLAAIDVLRRLITETSNDVGAEASAITGVVRRIAAYGAPAENRANAPKGVKDISAAAAPAAGPATPDSPEVTIQVAVHRLEQIDRLVGESAAAHLRVGQLLAERLGEDPATVTEYRDLTRLLTRLQDVTMRARMVPLATVIPSLHRAVRDVAKAGGKEVRWDATGVDTEIDRNVLERLRDPLLHLVRNAVDHGIEMPSERKSRSKPEQGTVRLHARQQGSEIVITISDDGGGIDVARVREAAVRQGIDTDGLTEPQIIDLIFRQGMSTASKITEISGRGVGLDVVRTNLNLLRGRVQVENQPDRGAVFTIAVPITLTIVQCLVVESGGRRFALPMFSIGALLHPETEKLKADGRQMVMHGSAAVPLTGLGEVFSIADSGEGPIVVVTGDTNVHGFRVDRVAGQRDYVVKGLSRLLPRLDCIAGAAIEPDGNVIVVLDASGLVRRGLQLGLTADSSAPPVQHRTSVLVADDTLIVRELERSILERAGYAVRVASDGLEAFELLQREPADLVVTDLEMPSLDGIGLTQAIRRHDRLAATPVVILTSHNSEKDRERGLAAGANAYIIKTAFDQQDLLSLVEQLLLAGRV